MNPIGWQTCVYQFLVRKKALIVWAFWAVYVALFGFVMFAGYKMAETKEFVYSEVGREFGEYAILTLLAAMLPGILGRYGIKVPITLTLTFFRRQLGILTFMLAFAHASLLYLLPLFLSFFPFTFQQPLFIYAGISALFFLFLLFITSNNYSVLKLGRWWKRLHRVVYLILWLILLHTAMQRWSIYAMLIGIVAVLETTSLLYSFFKKKQV